MKRDGGILFILGIVLLISVIMLLAQNKEVKMTGFATTETSTTSNVTISKFLSIALSGNLSSGIIFGTVNNLPAVNINASSNNNSEGGNTSFFINVSTDSNTPVDFCLKANFDLADSAGGNILSVANESYSNSTTINVATPDVAKEVAFTTSYVKVGENVSVGNVSYYRFYLDVPVGTPSGTYNNTINFKGVQNTVAC